jgi:hypothetical protein
MSKFLPWIGETKDKCQMISAEQWNVCRTPCKDGGTTLPSAGRTSFGFSPLTKGLLFRSVSFISY